MIYIKDGDTYFKYHITDDGRLICTDKHGLESIILYDISGEFDALVTDEEDIHFVLQGLNGELIYLKRENGTWKKYNIFKSRKGVRRIYGIKLVKSAENMCAFYIMEYTDKNLMVKHVFSASELYREPEVIDLSDSRKDFCVCMDEKSETHLFFKDENGARKIYSFDRDFKLKKAAPCPIDSGALVLRAEFIGNELCFAYTIPRKNSTALAFCKYDNPEDCKIITFGISRSCCPEIIVSDALTIIQWEENGAVMQSQSDDGGQTFSKPKPLGTTGELAGIRHSTKERIKCSKCAMHTNLPYIPGTNLLKKQKPNKGEIKNMNHNHNQNKSDIINDSYCREIFDKLKEIEADIDKMGKNLENMCSFLDKLKDYSKHNEIAITNKEDKKLALSGSDIGEVYENNIKLFESTDIDEILPDNIQQVKGE